MLLANKGISIIKNKTYQHGSFVLVILCIFVSMINAIFCYTYPINVASGDNPNYLIMMHDKASNLINASGYPAFMIALLRCFHILPGTTIYDLTWLTSIQILQYSIHMILFILCVFLCAKIFNKSVAVIHCLALGTSVFYMAGANSASPEWFQGTLLLLTLLISAYALVCCIKDKIMMHSLSWLVFSLAYLVKPNSLLFAPTILASIFFESKTFLWKVKALMLALITSYVGIFCYIACFHFPSTQSKQLSYDHAWVLSYAMPDGYISLPPEQLGMNTLRWRALVAIIPPDYGNADAYRSLDTGAPAAIREEYLSKYHEIMGMSKKQLVSFVNTHPLPFTYVKAASSVPLYWYIGLPETDALGIAVFKESVFLLPQEYLKKVVIGYKDYFFHPMNQQSIRQIVPFTFHSLGLDLSPNDKNNFFINAIAPNKLTRTDLIYWNPLERLWKPGVELFGVMDFRGRHPWPSFVLFLIACIGVCLTTQPKIKFFGCIYFIIILLFYTASFTLSGMRNKEIITILPTLVMFSSFGLVAFFKAVFNK
jgi:hypothetical protein